MTFGMETTPMILVIVSIFLFAAFIHGCIAFGFPMVATPLLALFTDLQTAIMLTLIPSAVINLISIKSEGPLQQALRRFLPLALFAMIGSAAGTQILILADSELFKILLGLAILYYLLGDRARRNLAWVRRFPDLSRAVFGVAAGLLGGLTNVMAPILIIYSLEARHTKAEIVQASNFCFLLGKIIQLVLFFINGRFAAGQLSLSSLGLCVSLAGLFTGIAIKKRIAVTLYTKILRALLLAISISLFFQVLLRFV